MTRGAILALGAGAAALAATAAHAVPDPSRFTFPWASHASLQEGDYAARQFVEKRLTPGLPMSEAVARAEAAKSNCGDWRAMSGDIVCRYFIGAATDQASLGAEEWTLTLTHGPDGKLATAAVDRRRSGLPGDLGTRAVFHWQFGD